MANIEGCQSGFGHPECKKYTESFAICIFNELQQKGIKHLAYVSDKAKSNAGSSAFVEEMENRGVKIFTCTPHEGENLLYNIKDHVFVFERKVCEPKKNTAMQTSEKTINNLLTLISKFTEN
jgi:hypothetical protein